MADICGAMWTDIANPCDLGSTRKHECYNMPDCDGKNRPHMCACEATPPTYEQQLNGYLEMRQVFREASIAEIQRLIPDGYRAVLFDFNDTPRLSAYELVADDGTVIDFDDLDDQPDENGMSLFDWIDQVAGDMELYDYDDAKSYLMRTEDRDRFIVNKD